MKLNELYPSTGVTITKLNLQGTKIAGMYCHTTDVIEICSSLLPMSSDLVELHELMHATGIRSRTSRRGRLITTFKSKAYGVEECIVELASMIVLRKLGQFNLYTMRVPISGIEKYYNKDFYIPWREVIAAVNYFKEDETIDFHIASDFVRRYATHVLKMDIRDTYETSNLPAVQQEPI